MATRQSRPMAEGLKNLKYCVMRAEHAWRIMERKARAEGSGGLAAEQRHKLELSKRCVERLLEEEASAIEVRQEEQREERKRVRWANMSEEGPQSAKLWSEAEERQAVRHGTKNNNAKSGREEQEQR